jgi:hypothetical protein
MKHLFDYWEKLGECLARPAGGVVATNVGIAAELGLREFAGSDFARY